MNLGIDRVKSKLDSRFRHLNCLSSEITFVPAISLITSERLDLAVKARFIKSYLSGKLDDRAKCLYYECLKITSNNSFQEPGDASKYSYSDYLDYFHKLAVSLKNDGFDAKKSIIPLSRNGIPLDGAHRIAVCAALGMDVAVVYLDKVDFKYDISYFRTRFVSESLIDEFLLTYIKMTEEELSVVIQWPLKRDISSLILAEYESALVYSKPVPLNYNGIKNLMLMNYWGEPWLRGDNFNNIGIHNKVKECFDVGPTVFYWVKGLSLEEREKIKNNIRKNDNGSKHALHSTDTQTEAVNISCSILHPQSRIELNNLYPELCSSSLSNILRESSLLKKDSIVVCGSSVMSLYGLRAANDIDSLADTKTEDYLVGSHNKYLQNYSFNKYSELYEEGNFFYYFGIKFLNILEVRYFKNMRGELKDMKDVMLIDSLKNPSSRPFSYKFKGLFLSAMQALLFLTIRVVKFLGIKEYVKKLIR